MLCLFRHHTSKSGRHALHNHYEVVYRIDIQEWVLVCWRSEDAGGLGISWLFVKERKCVPVWVPSRRSVLVVSDTDGTERFFLLGVALTLLGFGRGCNLAPSSLRVPRWLLSRSRNWSPWRARPGRTDSQYCRAPSYYLGILACG